MYSAMLVVTFASGIVLVVAGIVALFSRRDDTGRFDFILGHAVTLKVTHVAPFLVGLGVFLVVLAVTSAHVVSKRDYVITRRDDQLKVSNKLAAAITKVPTDPKTDSQLETVQKQAFESFLGLARDRNLALFLLQALVTNTFGLVDVPSENASKFEQLLVQISKQFTGDHRIEIELAKGYRSLYESTHDDRYLKEFHSLAFAARDADDPRDRFAANQLTGLALQRENKPDEALKYFEEAEKTVPEEERYKLDFNFCNALCSLKRDKDALSRCMEADRLAKVQVGPRGQKLYFWQPLFIEGLIHFRQHDPQAAVGAFLQCYEVASEAGEAGGLAGFLEEQEEREGLRMLCSDGKFAYNYREFCKGGNLSRPRPGPL